MKKEELISKKEQLQAELLKIESQLSKITMHSKREVTFTHLFKTIHGLGAKYTTNFKSADEYLDGEMSEDEWLLCFYSGEYKAFILVFINALSNDPYKMEFGIFKIEGTTISLSEYVNGTELEYTLKQYI